LPSVKTEERAAPAVERWRLVMAEASRRFGVPQAWIAAVMQAESRGQTHWKGRPITSVAGAMGLMQLMPGTWEAMRRRHGLGPDPHDPRDNILAGTAYLRAMYDRFGYPGLFAAYNAGPGRYADHLRTGRSLPSETRGYIAQLARMAAGPSLPLAIQSRTQLFFALGTAARPAANGTAMPLTNPLFVPLGQAREDEQ
jgi:soluble lytic murein transglycosylase-like protein